MRLTILSTLLFAGTALSAVSAQAAGELNLICSADVVICEQMKGDFEKSHDIKVNMVRLSSGETYAKVRAEARNPKTDIWWAGTGDPHMQAASENLTLEYKSPMLDQLQDWAVKQAESTGYRTVGVYAGALGWGYNTEIFKSKGYKEPKCWADLLAPEPEGRNPDRQSEFVWHRLYGAGVARADHGRGSGDRLSEEAQRQYLAIYQVRFGTGQGGGAWRNRARHRLHA